MVSGTSAKLAPDLATWHNLIIQHRFCPAEICSLDILAVADSVVTQDIATNRIREDLLHICLSYNALAL